VFSVPFLPRTHLTCPYCYSDFSEWQIEFRCTGLPGLGGRSCEPEPDPVLERVFGTTGDRPHTFSNRWRRYKAVCPASGAEAYDQVCPRCHHTLPVHFGRIRSQLVALVGARDTGKTVFMTVFMHEFRHRLGERLGVSTPGADDETRNSFRRDYEERLYTGRSLPDPTFTVAAERQGYRPPLVFRLKRKGWSLIPGWTRQTLLSFFDTAGEDLTTEASVSRNGRYLRAADAIILILDPLQTKGGRRVAASEALPPEPRLEDDPYNVLLRITEMLQKGHRDRKIGKPLAVVFTKLDALRQAIPEGSALKRSEPGGAGWDEVDSRDVHRDIQSLLLDWDGHEIDQYLQLNYQHFRYFGVSALGANPTPDKRLSSVPQPYRVTDPILWLLSRTRLVRVIRRH
jgi:hypothetical protein